MTTRYRHGLREHPMYGRWNGMMQRCTDANHQAYRRYGGRGITVCDRWKNFANFLADMGEAPVGMSLERIDGSKGYSPENCKWASSSEQMRNTSRTRMLTYNNRTMPLIQWANEIGIKESTLRERITKWSLDRALSTQKLKGSSHGNV